MRVECKDMKNIVVMIIMILILNIFIGEAKATLIESEVDYKKEVWHSCGDRFNYIIKNGNTIVIDNNGNEIHKRTLVKDKDTREVFECSFDALYLRKYDPRKITKHTIELINITDKRIPLYEVMPIRKIDLLGKMNLMIAHGALWAAEGYGLIENNPFAYSLDDGSLIEGDLPHYLPPMSQIVVNPIWDKIWSIAHNDKRELHLTSYGPKLDKRDDIKVIGSDNVLSYCWSNKEYILILTRSKKNSICAFEFDVESIKLREIDLIKFRPMSGFVINKTVILFSNSNGCSIRQFKANDDKDYQEISFNKIDGCLFGSNNWASNKKDKYALVYCKGLNQYRKATYIMLFDIRGELLNTIALKPLDIEGMKFTENDNILVFGKKMTAEIKINKK